MNLYDILMADDVKESIENNLESLINIIPEISCMFDFDQKNPHHHLYLWEHTLYAISLANKDFEVRLALLLHDIGKPFTCIESKGIKHFPNHAEVSAKMAKMILIRLGYDIEFIGRICYLVKWHDTPMNETIIYNDQELARKRFQIQKCDALAHNPAMLESREEYLDKIKRLLNQN